MHCITFLACPLRQGGGSTKKPRKACYLARLLPTTKEGSPRQTDDTTQEERVNERLEP